MANRKGKRTAQKMATIEEGGAGDSSVQPEGSLNAEVTVTVPATLSAADGADEAAVDVHSSPQLKRRDISPIDEHRETRKFSGQDTHSETESEETESEEADPNLPQARSNKRDVQIFNTTSLEHNSLGERTEQPSNDLAQQIKALRTENQELRERNILLNKLFQARERERTRVTWGGSERSTDSAIEKYCERLQFKFMDWLHDYAIEDVNTVDPMLSASEKQSIITSLDGYSRAQKFILRLFAQTLWTKHLFEDIFLKPFLYFDFYGQEEMTSTAGKPDTSLPTQLLNMYQMFRTVDEAQAEVWRGDTVRLANSWVPENEIRKFAGQSSTVGPNSHVLGERSKQARRSAVERLVSSILDGPMRLMLRELDSPEEADLRKQIIIQIYCDVAELAAHCWATRARWEIRGLDKVDNFYWHPETLTPHFWQLVNKYDPRLDGKAVLLVMQPQLFRVGGMELQYGFDMLLGKALVVVEDPAPT
ncbi:uncharacterized protein CDV56_106886 [Aspergillus thermomutatus]|uniref:Uncharacterized protein n=1 Tax=Aspergillus thermomutatus TaxID=41047 RepID=A0A397HUK4_ASPTH|nr:uncharacterized protein CDV56_106886 [Aspergillus thermomutatus]RHZ65658.1 hypothetical protein CDV56_106886 [Aspergillus thermomutatus]